uniref:Uncharacterized protein n=1 Tax=Pararge aegeria TaxID=116150 RepID=S4P331_9NEOP
MTASSYYKKCWNLVSRRKQMFHMITICVLRYECKENLGPVRLVYDLCTLAITDVLEYRNTNVKGERT